jgi:hypothetical protein
VAEILGLGMTHFPGFTRGDEELRIGTRMLMKAPRVDPRWRDPGNYTPNMIRELGGDDGLTAARNHCEWAWGHFRAMRKRIDEFAPDFAVIIADDQYENFKEDIIPTFCVLGLDDVFEQKVWTHRAYRNYWNEPQSFVYPLRGHRDGARCLATGLIERGVPMPYAYKTLHDPVLAHGFSFTVLFLDWERRGFPHPIVPFHVNCYGSNVIRAKGATAHLYQEPASEGMPDPPGPSPALCMDVGARMAQAILESPYRVVLIASSSWSHCFLSPKHGYVLPDHETDRKLFAALKDGDYGVWRRQTLQQIEWSGQHEMLNWFVLAGAMSELERKPTSIDYRETDLFLSNKCFAVFD